jgi:hypothetical protein
MDAIRKADISYKAVRRLASTSTQRAYYEETHAFAQRVFPSQIWLQADLIPGTAPGGGNDQITGVVQRKIDLVLTQEPGKPNAWFSSELKDAIDPQSFGVDYAFTLKDGGGASIPPGTGEYEVNPDAGLVTFDDAYVVSNTPISISFYKYVGTKGVGSGGGGGVSLVWVDDAPALRSLTDHDDQNTMQVFDTFRVYKYIASSNLPDDGIAVIKPNDVSGSGRWIAWKTMPSTSDEMELGAAPAGKDWSDGVIAVNATSKQNDFNYRVSTMLSLLAPAPPTQLLGAPLDMTTYVALQAGSGVSHDCTDNVQPSATMSTIYDPKTGDIYAEIDNVEDGRITLTDGDDTGVDGSFSILSNTDPYAGQPGKEGFYTALNMQLLSSTNLSVGLHSYSIEHVTEGASALLSFWVDDPGNATVSSVTITRPGSTTRYVSGVPSLASGQLIEFDFTVNGAVGTHYNPTRLATLVGSEIGDVSIPPPGTPPAQGSNPVYTGQSVAVASGRYDEDINVVITPYNSKDVAGTPSNQVTGCRVDTVSDESARLRSGSGQFPAAGYGSSYDSSVSLKDAGYTEELQLLNGQYQVPTGNYAGNQPTAGPDYSTGTGSIFRYALPQASFSVNSASGFTITFNNSNNLSAADLDTDNIRVQVKVEGVTGWMDANASFALVGAPSADGDACMVNSSSNATVRRVSFGNVPRTGNVHVRIGLPSGSTKRFGGITISNIV